MVLRSNCGILVIEIACWRACIIVMCIDQWLRLTRVRAEKQLVILMDHSPCPIYTRALFAIVNISTHLWLINSVSRSMNLFVAKGWAQTLTINVSRVITLQTRLPSHYLWVWVALGDQYICPCAKTKQK